MKIGLRSRLVYINGVPAGLLDRSMRSHYSLTRRVSINNLQGHRYMKHRLLTFAGALALLAVLGKYYATPLLGQVRAALVKNIDEKGRIAYQAGGSCAAAHPGSVGCTVTFPPVPLGKRLVIEYVSAPVASNTLGPMVAALNVLPSRRGLRTSHVRQV